MIDRVRKLISTKFLAGNNEFENSDSLRDLGLTSLKFVELIILIEDEFLIEIPDEDIDRRRFSTVDNIVGYVEGRLKQTQMGQQK
jgi:acyl carrier protein